MWGCTKSRWYQRGGEWWLSAAILAGVLEVCCCPEGHSCLPWVLPPGSEDKGSQSRQGSEAVSTVSMVEELPLRWDSSTLLSQGRGMQGLLWRGRDRLVITLQYLIIMHSGSQSKTFMLSYAAFAESPAQGQVPVLRDTLQTKSGREREALPRKGVLRRCGAH